MPAVALLAVGAAGGFFAAKGTDGLSTAIKWAVVGGGVFVAAKAFKVI